MVNSPAANSALRRRVLSAPGVDILAYDRTVPRAVGVQDHDLAAGRNARDSGLYKLMIGYRAER